MYLEVNRLWEIAELAVSTSDGDEFISYPLVEICGGTGSYLCNFNIKIRGVGTHGRQFLVASAEGVVEVVKNIEAQSTHVNYLKRNGIGGEVTVLCVREILSGKNSDGRMCFLTRCDDGMDYADSIIVKSKNDLKDIIIQYTHSD